MKSNEDRLMELEVQLANVQWMYDQLNKVVTEEAMRADRMQRKLEQLTKDYRELKTKSGEPPTDPVDEKPPHY